MNISIINVSQVIASDGSRLISSILKKAGHKINMYFLPVKGGLIYKELHLYEESDLQKVYDKIKDTDMVMISVMSPFSLRAEQVTEYIKQRKRIPIVWGGTHSTVLPERCLDFADIVCIGGRRFDFRIR